MSTQEKNKKKAIGQMFLSTDRVKIVQANKDNIVFYNKIYEGFRSKEAREEFTVPPEGYERMIYYDGSSRSDNLCGGAGSVLFEGTNEVAAKTKTIPYATNNVAEFEAALDGIMMAKARGWKEVIVLGDCEILTKKMRMGTKCRNWHLERRRKKIEKELDPPEAALYKAPPTPRTPSASAQRVKRSLCLPRRGSPQE